MRTILSVLLVAAFASPAAAQTTIDFDDLTVSSCVYATAPDLAVQYTAMGVTFSGDLTSSPKVVPASCLTITGASTPNIVALSGSGNYLRADFAPAVATVSLAVGNYNRIETFTLTAYDAGDTMLASSTLSPPFRMFRPVSVAASGIAYVVLTAVHSENAVDDLTFGSTLPIDAGTPDSGPPDLGVDAGSDAGGTDAGSDAGTADSGTVDAGTSDAGTPDAGALDAGTSDAGASDAGGLDAGRSDAGGMDAGVRDAGARDASPDAGTPPPAGGGCCRVASGSSAPWPGLVVVLGLALARARRRR